MTLTVRDLTVARGGLPILQRVSFTLTRGQALFLRGPNGCGKTSLLRTLAGLQPAEAGQIEVADDAIAYAAHADGLKATLSVAENLTFWARIFGQGDIGKAVQAFDLTDLLDRPAQNLSAGQKRRLGLARLLVTGRPIWMLDEPTVSLDKTAVQMFAGVIRHHLKDGGMALIATHIDLGFEAETLDLTGYKAVLPKLGEFDEAFL